MTCIVASRRRWLWARASSRFEQFDTFVLLQSPSHVEVRPLEETLSERSGWIWLRNPELNLMESDRLESFCSGSDLRGDNGDADERNEATCYSDISSAITSFIRLHPSRTHNHQNESPFWSWMVRPDGAPFGSYPGPSRTKHDRYQRNIGQQESHGEMKGSCKHRGAVRPRFQGEKGCA